MEPPWMERTPRAPRTGSRPCPSSELTPPAARAGAARRWRRELARRQALVVARDADGDDVRVGRRGGGAHRTFRAKSARGVRRAKRSRSPRRRYAPVRHHRQHPALTICLQRVPKPLTVPPRPRPEFQAPTAESSWSSSPCAHPTAAGGRRTRTRRRSHDSTANPRLYSLAARAAPDETKRQRRRVAGDSAPSTTSSRREWLPTASARSSSPRTAERRCWRD